MTDSSNRTSLGRRSIRGDYASRASNARTSGAFDDYACPSGATSVVSHAHTLRPVESRFSLNEHFAATRREYEFNNEDDMSSLFDRFTIASESGVDQFEDATLSAIDAVVPQGEALLVEDGADFGEEDFYDLFCLPRDGSVTPEQIRRAYYRLFLLLHQDGHPESHKAAVAPYFIRVQKAFETLIDPHRRAEYDLSSCDEAACGLSVSAESAKDAEEYTAARRDYIWQQVTSVMSDIGIRFDASKPVTASQLSLNKRRWWPLRPLDFALGHSITIGLPGVGPILERKAHAAALVIKKHATAKHSDEKQLAENLERSLGPGEDSPGLSFGTPSLSLSASVYGLIEELYMTPISLLSDRYQPMLPLAMPRKRVIQLAENKLSPLISLKLRQEVSRRISSGYAAKSIIELESEVLPEPVLGIRVAHPIYLPTDPIPVHIGASVHSGWPWGGKRPRVGLSAERAISHEGIIFARLDSGDWSLWPGETCKFFTEFSRMHKNFFYSELPLKSTPSIEVGYSTSPCERAALSRFLESPHGESGMAGLDLELSSPIPAGSWTVAAAASSNSISGYLRYGRDLISSTPPSHILQRRGDARVEVELCSNSLLDRYLAFRNLWNVGRYSKLGLEVGMSIYNFHVSLYWSRQNQRISIPFLVSPRAYLSSEVVFWAGVVPFVAMAGLELFKLRSKASNRNRKFAELKKRGLAEYITRKRQEADELAAVLADPVEVRQRMERQNGGLVILSAKFGVKAAGASGNGWGAEEVADVTIAVAALVEGGKLVIPRGVRKASILGFWDPAPTRKKVLHIRYLCNGKENTVEVFGKDELFLPM
jgi:DnaJ homolog subfamily C member 11